MHSQKRRFIRFYLLAALIIVITLSGFRILSRKSEDINSKFDYLDLYTQIFELVYNTYLEPVNPGILAEGTVEGMLMAVSPYCHLEPINGDSDLIHEIGPLDAGIVLGYKKPFIRVIDVIEDSPADKAGVFPGDILYSVDGTTTPNYPVQRVSEMLTGIEDDSIELVIQHITSGKVDELSLVLKPYDDNSGLILETKENYLYASIKGELTKNTIDNLTNYFHEHEKCQGLILDLRHLNRGNLNLGLDLADIFVTDGHILAQLCSNRRDINLILESHDNKEFIDFPIFIIADNTTAGAAELCAMILADQKRATLIGNKTFGFGLYFDRVPLNDNFNMLIAIAKYCDSKGTSYHQTGLDPIYYAPRPENRGEDPEMELAFFLIKQSQVVS